MLTSRMNTCGQLKHWFTNIWESKGGGEASECIFKFKKKFCSTLADMS